MTIYTAFLIATSLWCDSKSIKNPLSCRQMMTVQCRPMLHGFGVKDDFYECAIKAASSK